jgi:hypothetical protein
LAGHENDSLELTKTKTSAKIELTQTNVEMNYISNDLDCNQ